LECPLAERTNKKRQKNGLHKKSGRPGPPMRSHQMGTVRGKGKKKVGLFVGEER